MPTRTRPGRTGGDPGQVTLDIQRYCTRTNKYLLPDHSMAPKAHVGKVNVAALKDATGLTYHHLWTLVRHPDRIDRLTLSTLARLCHALDCTPADILRYTPYELPMHTRPLNDAAYSFEQEMGLR